MILVECLLVIMEQQKLQVQVVQQIYLTQHFILRLPHIMFTKFFIMVTNLQTGAGNIGGSEPTSTNNAPFWLTIIIS